MGIVQDKRVLIVGARNRWSIGWHCGLSLAREGAKLAFSVYSDREKGDVEKLLRDAGLEGIPIFLCDATKEEDIARLSEEAGRAFAGRLEGLLHRIAFATREDLPGQLART